MDNHRPGPTHPPIIAESRPPNRLFHLPDDEQTDEYALNGKPYYYLARRPLWHAPIPQTHPSTHARHDTLVISVSGAAFKQQTPLARAAAGVFVHEDSPRNFSAVVDDGPQTRRYAATVAAAAALDIAVDACAGRLHDLPSHPQRIVVKTTSADLVRVMTESIFEWRRRAFFQRGRKPIVHRGLWARIDAAARRVEATGVQLQFWPVVDRDVSEAYALAYRALETLDSERQSERTVQNPASTAEPARSSPAAEAVAGRAVVGDQALEVFFDQWFDDAAPKAETEEGRTAVGARAEEAGGDAVLDAGNACDTQRPNDTAPAAEKGESSTAARVGEVQGVEYEVDDEVREAAQYFPLAPDDFEWAFGMARGVDWKLGPEGWERDISGRGRSP